MSIRRIQILLLKVFLLLMPYHYMLFAVVLKDISFLKLWRDAVIILIFLLGMVRNGKIKVNSSLVVNIALIFLNIIYIIIAPAKFQAINITRVYLLPLLLFKSIRELHLNKSEIQQIAKLVMYNTIIVCLYGIFQAYVLGGTFLIKLGYATNGKGGLPASFYLSNYEGSSIGRGIQRVVSTFSAANICAFYMSVIFIVFLYAHEYLNIKKRTYFIFMVIVFATIALILVGIKRIFNFIKKMKLPVIAAVMLLLGVIVVFDPLREALIHVFVSSASGSDTSMLSHYSTIDKAYELIKENPMGLGLGVNGPRALNYGASNKVESSILLMVFEYGIIGAALYFYNYVYIAVKAYSYRAYGKNLASLNICLVAFTLIAYINIPYVQEMECTSLFFICTGLVYGVLTDKKKEAFLNFESIRDKKILEVE